MSNVLCYIAITYDLTGDGDYAEAGDAQIFRCTTREELDEHLLRCSDDEDYEFYYPDEILIVYRDGIVSRVLPTWFRSYEAELTEHLQLIP